MLVELNTNDDYIPITITLVTRYEAEVIMDIVSRIAGCGEKSPRKVADDLYCELVKLGVCNRDEKFEQKYKAEGRIVYEDNPK